MTARYAVELDPRHPVHVMTAVAAPVIAQPGMIPCRKTGPRGDNHGVYCERPKGHPGGHRSESHDTYWQAEEPQS